MGGSVVFVRWHQCASHQIHASSGPPESTSQTTSRSAQPFLQGRRTLSVQSYSPDGANMHPHVTHASFGHRSPNTERHLDRIGRFCTAHGRESLYFTTGRLFSPIKLPLMCDLNPHLIHGSLGHLNPQPKRHLDRFSRFCTALAERPYTLQWAAFLPQNCPMSWGISIPI